MADLLLQLHDQALRVTGGHASVLLRFDPRTDTLHPVSAAGLNTNHEPWLADDAGQSAAARVWKSGTPQTFDNLPLLLARLESPAAVLVPLLSRHEPLGLLVLSVDSARKGRKVQGDLATVGDLVAVALDCARLQRETDLQRDISVLVSDITRAVSSSLHLHASLGIFCERAAPLFSAESVAIWLHDRRARVLNLVAASAAGDLTPPQQIRSG